MKNSASSQRDCPKFTLESSKAAAAYELGLGGGDIVRLGGKGLKVF